jgi:hypothetical protein
LRHIRDWNRPKWQIATTLVMLSGTETNKLNTSFFSHNPLVNLKLDYLTFRVTASSLCTRYPCLLKKMKLLMHVLSLALLAITGVTAESPVRAYHPSLFVCFRESSTRCYRAAQRVG